MVARGLAGRGRPGAPARRAGCGGAATPGSRPPAGRPRRGAAFVSVALAAGVVAAEPAGFAGRSASTRREAPGAIEGTVTLAGTTLPSSTRVTNSTDPEVCGTEHSLEDLIVAPGGRGVRHVVAALVDVPAERVPERGPDALVLDNRDCRFRPHVLAATVGDTIVAVNADPTLHNTHYYGPLRSNVALSRQGMRVARVVRRPGLVSVLCDVHGWMKAYVRVDPHPFHAVTGADGRFRIEGVPPGRHTLELWHERLGTRRVEVEVAPGRTAAADVVYDPPED